MSTNAYTLQLSVEPHTQTFCCTSIFTAIIIDLAFSPLNREVISYNLKIKIVSVIQMVHTPDQQPLKIKNNNFWHAWSSYPSLLLIITRLKSYLSLTLGWYTNSTSPSPVLYLLKNWVKWKTITGRIWFRTTHQSLTLLLDLTFWLFWNGRAFSIMYLCVKGKGPLTLPLLTSG